MLHTNLFLRVLPERAAPDGAKKAPGSARGLELAALPAIIAERRLPRKGLAAAGLAFHKAAGLQAVQRTAPEAEPAMLPEPAGMLLPDITPESAQLPEPLSGKADMPVDALALGSWLAAVPELEPGCDEEELLPQPASSTAHSKAQAARKIRDRLVFMFHTPLH